MILRGKIHNFAGIQKFDIDFTQKHIYEKEQAEQVGHEGSDYFALVPTFLAKNTSGKTSIIRALDFALSFATQDKFYRQIQFYFSHLISMTEFYFRTKDIEESRNIDTNSRYSGGANDFDFNSINVLSNAIDELVQKIFVDLSYAGSNKINLKLELTKNRKIQIILSENDFRVILNDQLLDVKNLLMLICKNWGLNKNGLQDCEYAGFSNDCTLKKIQSIISKHIEQVRFCDNANSASLFQKNKRSMEFSSRHKTNKFISDLISSFGFKNVSLFLQKIDDKIQKIQFDTSEKSFDIFHKDNDVPISPRNLSFGTQKILQMLALSLPLFKNGGILLVDEIENGLHLSLIQLLVSIFEDEDINTAQAQLFMTTHNPLLVERLIVQPFNIYVMEKSVFCNIKTINFKKKRTYSFFQSFKTKNYFNDLFWLDNNLEDKSTLSNLAINQIITEMSSKVKWTKK